MESISRLIRPSKLRFFNIIDGVAPNYPITPATSQRPWLKQPNEELTQLRYQLKHARCPFTRRIGNVAKCPGIASITSTGYTIQTPVDIRIVSSPTDLHIDLSTNEFLINYHTLPYSCPNTHNKIIKFDFGWRVQASNDILLQFIPIPYTEENRFTSTTGILDPQISSTLNVQLYWHVFDGVTIIRAGTPMTQIIPMKREFNPNVVVDEEYTINDIRRLKNETFKLQSTFD
jgi:hypothetical protein